MDVFVVVLVISALLRERITLATDFFFSSNGFSWTQANNYCNNNNGRLILFESQDDWDDCRDALDTLNKCKIVHWTGLKLYDCLNSNPQKWSYNGWSNWALSHEPDDCPGDACVVVTCSGMKTRQCGDTYIALCRKVPTTTQRTSVVTSDAETTTQNTPTAEVTSDAETTTQTTPTAVVTSDVRTTTQTTPTAVVTSDAETTIQTTPTAVVTSDADITTQTTPTVVVTSDAETTTQTTPTAVVTSDAETTTQTTPTAVVTSDAETTTQTTPTAVVTSDAETTTQTTPAYVVTDICDDCCVKNNMTKQLNQEELKHAIQELKSQLAVNKTNLSANRRKLISVYDSRSSSVAIGGVAISMVTVTLVVVVYPDMVSLARFLLKLPQKHRH